MIEALGSDPCADRIKCEASTFPTACCKFHQEVSVYQRFLANAGGSDGDARQLAVEPDCSNYACGYRLSATIERRSKRVRGPRKSISESAYTATTKLLNFASALTMRFRIVWTVTILQQAVPCFYGDRMARDGPEALHTTAQSAMTQGTVCQSVEQVVALFPYLRTRPN